MQTFKDVLCWFSEKLRKKKQHPLAEERQYEFEWCKTQNYTIGRFSEEPEILYKDTWAAVEGVKEALEWPTNISKEEHVIITCFSAFIREISSNSAAFAHKSLHPELTAPFAKSEKYSQIWLKCNDVST